MTFIKRIIVYSIKVVDCGIILVEINDGYRIVGYLSSNFCRVFFFSNISF